MRFVGEGFQHADVHGWQARLRLDFEAGPDRTLLARREQRGPLAVQRPFYPEGSPCHVYVLHPPGGLVGGDVLSIEVRVGEGAQALITTPGAAKLYRSAGPAPPSRCSGSGWRRAGPWNGCPRRTSSSPVPRLRLRTELDLEPGAAFIGWEVQCLGRPAIGERFETGGRTSAFSYAATGCPCCWTGCGWTDGQGLDGAAGLRGYPVTGTLVACPALPADLEAVRADAAPTLEPDLPWGATLLGDLLVVRCLAQGTEPVRRLFVAPFGAYCGPDC